MSKKNGKNIYERLDALKEAHPNMIWKWGAMSGAEFGRSDKTYVYVKCICPEGYYLHEADTATPYCTLGGMYVIEDGEYTIIGAKRKVSALEKMDWTKFDDIAAKARDEQKQIQKKVDALYEAANRPLSDKDYLELEKKVNG